MSRTPRALTVVVALLLVSPLAWAQRRRSPGAAKDSAVVRVLREIEHGWRSGHYTHDTRVDAATGRYEFDCSAMVAWVLRRATPAAEREVELRERAVRPLARHYQRHLAHPGDRSAWRAVPRVSDARPGDVIAWTFPSWIRTSVTGHVAFLMEPPRPYAGRAHTFVLRIADSSSVPHDRDTRDRGRFRGFGYGDIYVSVDPVRGTPVAYRPNLRLGTGFLRTAIAIARPIR